MYQLFSHFVENYKPTIMKKISTIFSLFLMFGHVFGQNINNSDNLDVSATSSSINFTQGSVTIGSTNQSYYHFENGEVANISNLDWDLAFDASGYGSSIRINGASGTELYVYPNGDTSSWSTLDTTGLSNWNKIHNSDTSWGMGAFNVSSISSDPFDLGWGTYSMITHFITGDSLHIIKLSDGNFKKLHLHQLAGGIFSFKYADIDGSNEVETTITKDDYQGKNFGYYSLQTNQAIDREPSADSWHIVLTKYITQFAPGMPYGVTGVLTNAGLETAKVEDVAVNESTESAYNNDLYNSRINNIGWDWKSFSMATFSYSIQDSLSHFVKDVDNNIWKVVMTGYVGSGVGNITFNTEQIGFTGQYELENETLFNVYPNPAVGSEVSILYDIDQLDINNRLDIFDMNGRIVKSMKLYNSGFNDKRISLDNFESGIYLISLTNGNEVIKRKLIVQ